MTKIHYITLFLKRFSFYEGQRDQGVTQLVIKPFEIFQTSRTVSLTQKKFQTFPNPLLFFIHFLDNTSHKFWDQSPSPHDQCYLHVSETVSSHNLQCCYSANMLQYWIGGRSLIYFCKVDHSRISINYSRNWLRLNNLCEIL